MQHYVHKNGEPETLCMLCNKMQIPIHLFTPVRLNMFSARCGGGLAAAEAMRLVQSALTVNIVPTSSEMPSAMRKKKKNPSFAPVFLLEMNKVTGMSPKIKAAAVITCEIPLCVDQLVNSIRAHRVNP